MLALLSELVVPSSLGSANICYLISNYQITVEVTVPVQCAYIFGCPLCSIIQLVW